MSRWEYCSIELDYGFAGAKAIVFMTAAGATEPQMLRQFVPPHGKLETAIAKLGQEGWELVSADGKFLYFKRPVQ